MPRAGAPPVTPIYTQADAVAALDAFRPVEYETWVRVMPGVRARYWNAGHLLGSASIEIEFAGEGAAGKPLRVLASGDIGPDAKLLRARSGGADRPRLRDLRIDLWRRRSAAGHRANRGAQHLAAEVRAAHAAGGALLIPAFAVERTQELIVDLVDLMERGEIPAAPIFLDSPLAIRATEVFRQHADSLEADLDVDRLLDSPHLRCTETVDESKAIAKLTGFHIIIAASGMCDAGRIRHHLKRWLWHAKATVLLVGFQAQGTLGRFLADGAKAVRIQGEEIKVAARIRRLDEYSGHADGPELARWIAARRPIERGVFLVHGEEPALAGLSERIAERTVPAAKVFTPLSGRHLRTDHGGADADRRRAPPAAGARGGGQSRLAQRHVEADPRHQRAIEAAADDRARGVIIRRLRRALEGEG